MCNEKINLRDIHSSYWRCRDFELANLWQRSVFLTAFIVLSFTVYGVILSKFPNYLGNNYDTVYLILNGISFCISMVGIIFSILWVKMAKGSKAWYERYESAITSIESNSSYANVLAIETGGFSYTKLQGYKPPPIDHRLFKNTGGAYSVSKINISIGQIFLVVWFLIGIGHTILITHELIYDQELTSWGIFAFILGVLLLICTWLIIGNKNMFKSGTI